VKVVIDTNVLISAILRDRLPERVLVFIARQDDMQWVATQAIIDEYQKTLVRPKFAIPAAELIKQFAFIDQFALKMEANIAVDFPRDRKDEKFLICARAAHADYLITGDRDFAEAQRLIATRIVSVAEFARIMDIS